MFDYLQQFNKLPKELRDKVSSPAAMEILSSLEGKYGVSLAMVVMQIMVKQIPVRNLTAYFMTEMGLSADKAQSLNQELQERLLFSVSTYLGLKPLPVLSPEEKELQVLMKDNAIVLPSQDLMTRCRQILMTFRKGIRTKIDTRAALERAVSQGGLGLDAAAADRLLRALEQPVSNNFLAPPAVSAAITDLVNKAEAGAYDFKAALASGQIKAPAALADKFKAAPIKLDPSHELEAPDQELSLPTPPVPYMAPPVAVPTPPSPSLTLESLSAPVGNLTNTVVKEVKPLVMETPVAVKTDNLENDKNQFVANELKPALEAEASFKKAPVASAGLWAKLFKGKSPKPDDSLGKIISSSSHLEAAVLAATQAATISPRPAASSETRTRMEDVRSRPKVMGPLEELRYLDLTNFRRLGNNPKEITAKIVMKIRLLEKDGYDRMVEGVQSWRQSPVNRIYVRLAQEAVAKGMTLREIIAARQADNKETLSMDEIEAIVAMNSQLMF
jgi:hypothetical protein